MGRLMFHLIGVSPLHFFTIIASSAQTLSLGPTRNGLYGRVPILAIYHLGNILLETLINAAYILLNI
jgi:hypothetical protein